MSGVETVAGTKISISAAKPTTFDAAGYTAVATWAKIGEITDGGSHGRTYAAVTHQPIDNRGTQKFKGSFNEGQKTLQLGIDSKDPGQIVVTEALDSDDDYSFKVEYQGGDVDYFQAKVFSFVTAGGEANTVRTVSANIRIDRQGVVEVLA